MDDEFSSSQLVGLPFEEFARLPIEYSIAIFDALYRSTMPSLLKCLKKYKETYFWDKRSGFQSKPESYYRHIFQLDPFADLILKDGKIDRGLFEDEEDEDYDYNYDDDDSDDEKENDWNLNLMGKQFLLKFLELETIEADHKKPSVQKARWIYNKFGHPFAHSILFLNTIRNMDSKAYEQNIVFESKAHNQCSKRIQDCISELPDDILHGILSTLPLKEAGRTSVLSPRWRNLWRHTSSLNFDAHETMQELYGCSFTSSEESDSDLWLAASHEYVNWVNSVLRSHQGLTLNEFRIRFHLERSSEKEISDWVKFALNKKVQRLELNLLFSDDGDYDQDPDEKNVFPQDLRNSQHHTLRSLCLRAVLVSGEDIACLLRNCPLLEQLIVSSSDVLTSLEVCGSSLALKQLEIWCCQHLTSLKVSAPNLSSLTLYKLEGLVLEDVPKLVSVYVSCMVLLPTISCCFSQLEMLTLDFCEVRTPMFKFPEMLKLKKLVIMYYTSKANRSLLGLVSSFFKASPFMQELVFKV